MPLCGENRMIEIYIYIYIYVKFVSDKHWKERYGAQEVDQTILIILHYYLATERLLAVQRAIIT